MIGPLMKALNKALSVLLSAFLLTACQVTVLDGKNPNQLQSHNLINSAPDQNALSGSYYPYYPTSYYPNSSYYPANSYYPAAYYPDAYYPSPTACPGHNGYYPDMFGNCPDQSGSYPDYGYYPGAYYPYYPASYYPYYPSAF